MTVTPKPADVSPASVGAPFTPAPWHARIKRASVGIDRIGYAHQVVIGRHEYTVGHSDVTRRVLETPLPDGYVRTTAVEPFPPEPEPNADAHLIAAAPELYEALDLCVLTCPLPDEAIAKALDALAKAQGKSA